MRSTALLLVLSLVSPTVVTAVCELACLQAHQQTAGAAVPEDCHRHDAGPAPVASVASAGTVLCHGGAPPPSAIVKATPQLAPTPALIVRPRLLEVHATAASSLRGSSLFRPPDVLLSSTQLRV